LNLGFKRQDAPQWAEDSRFVLRNASVNAIQDPIPVRPEAWPDHLVLDGFNYNHLGGLGAQGDADMALRKPEWFIKWLEKDESSSPKPYHQLAKVLEGSGHKEKANDILYACKECERDEARKSGNIKRYVGLTFLKLFIGYGYGYRYFFTLIWVFFFTLYGALILSGTDEGFAFNISGRLAFSLDQLLPIVELDETRHLIKFEDSIPRYYFYFHKLMGYIMASFLIAGLSGITKK
jgi:hypothetical protein